MPDIDRDDVNIPCPSCRKDIRAEYRQLWGGSREVKCRCGAKLKFDSSLASQARREADDMDRARRDFQKAFQRMITEKVEVKGA